MRALAVGAWKWGPEAVRMKRLDKHWQREARHYDIAAANWDSIRGANGRHGPRPLMMHTLGKTGIEGDPWQVGRAGLREIRVLEEASAAMLAGQAVHDGEHRRCYFTCANTTVLVAESVSELRAA